MPRSPKRNNPTPAASHNTGQSLPKEIAAQLKEGAEQQGVVGPLVALLGERGWSYGQMTYGRSEWRVPKTPSEASKREKGQTYDGFPCDIAIFDSQSHGADYRHLRIIVECKTPDERAGANQLEILLGLEPHAQLGIWVNNPDPGAPCVFVFKTAAGMVRRRGSVADLPRLGDSLSPTAEKVTFADLIEVKPDVSRRIFSSLLDDVVTNDSNVTRRDDQLDQLCNLILLKLESDKKAKLSPGKAIGFSPRATVKETAELVRADFTGLVRLYPDVFTSAKDRELRLTDDTICRVVTELYRLRLLEMGGETVSIAFQILRAAALKQGEGQYFTPQPVIQAAVALMEVEFDDIVVDPACGTGGFLIETLRSMLRRNPGRLPEVARWAQTHIFGVDKDAVGVKLTKAVMQILGDGSVNCVRGDAIRTYLWPTDYRHLLTGAFGNDRFTVVLTNPPFGVNLRVPAVDARQAGLDIARTKTGSWEDLEIGLLFLNRCWELLRRGGRMCIVLPETYFFSPQYTFVQKWLQGRLRPLGVVNVPMEAFQDFCRAKTNLYVFEKT